MPFDAKAYGTQVAEILALDQSGQRLIPLVSGVCSSEAARGRLKKLEAADLFPTATAPREALGGLWLYFSCFNECHEIVQDLNSPEASFWHAILHRQEPDDGNAAYWFRRLGRHPVFDPLAEESRKILARFPKAEFRVGLKHWDPYAFIAYCGRARRQPGTPQEQAAMEIQRAEWQILFDYCAKAPA